uniref:PPE2 n=1 Tax=Mycobacterium intracellulare (strain ATCC 13950 / DSM 43223 / JCM 6384 / NCTC 13025 / 3600) TaxID=487521 RepID=B7T009_MYCIA|nr:PPE2 [Mycobacterium intracellulare ATCC 13950]
MADPGWAARTPEENDLLLKAGAGVVTHLANQAAWTALAATHHGSSIASTINTVATSASWTGAGSLASAANATALNASLHGLAGWVDVKPAVVSTAVSAYQMAYGSMRPAPECIENRTETATDYGINPLVLGALTPRITSLELEYFGSMWPNNSAVGASYGSILTALSSSLTIPPPIAARRHAGRPDRYAGRGAGDLGRPGLHGSGRHVHAARAADDGGGPADDAGSHAGDAGPDADDAAADGHVRQSRRHGHGRGDARGFRGLGHRAFGGGGRRGRVPGQCGRPREHFHPSGQRIRARHQWPAGGVAPGRCVGRRGHATADHDDGRRPDGRHARGACGGRRPRIP